MLAFLFVTFFAGGFAFGWLVRHRMRRYLPDKFHVRYVADTSQAVAALRALDDAANRAPVDATIRIRVEMDGAGKETAATYTLGDAFDDETPHARAARLFGRAAKGKT